MLAALIDIVCGGLAGVSGNLVGHPADTLKLRKQISTTGASSL